MIDPGFGIGDEEKSPADAREKETEGPAWLPPEWPAIVHHCGYQ
jgi:hypothetical protein